MDQRLTAQGEPPARIEAAEMDFSENELGVEGIRPLCAMLQKYNVHCHVLRLCGNALSDDALQDITRYLTSSSWAPVQELHLVENRFSSSGVEWLLTCLSTHPAYPI